MAQSRRKFLNIVIGGGLVGWLASVLYPVFSFLKPPKIAEATVSSVKWGAAADFVAGTSEIVKFGRTPVLLIRLDNGDFRAFEATCTHLDCTVQFRSDKKDIWCACHNGVYDLRGLNVSGPPPRPLDEYAVTVVDGEVFVSRAEA
jgi:Rieske Fe-S protein